MEVIRIGNFVVVLFPVVNFNIKLLPYPSRYHQVPGVDDFLY